MSKVDKNIGHNLAEELKKCTTGISSASNTHQSLFIKTDNQFSHNHTISDALWEEYGVDGFEPNIQSSGVSVGYLSSLCWPDVLFTAVSSGVITYQNNSGSFTNKKALSNESIYSAAIADLDGDYKNDIVLGGFVAKPSFVLKNIDNVNYQIFDKDKTGIKPKHYTVGFAMGDYDRDGDIDLLTTHWTVRANIDRSAHLRENIGNMRFSAKDSKKGLTNLVNSMDLTFSSAFSDVNSDGWADILVAADFKTSQTYLNNQGTFTRTTNRDVITDENGMGSAIADFDNDGDLDWFVTSIFNDSPDYRLTAGTGNRLYTNNGQGVWQDQTSVANVRDGAWGWGACAADFDNDGDVDIFHANGYFNIPQKYISSYNTIDLEQNIDAFLNTPSKLFMNDGQGRFVEQASAWQIADTKQGRGVACFDYDRDGDIDVVIANNQDKPSFYVNQIAGKPNANFINLRLVGLTPNTQALGALVKVSIQGKQQIREANLNSNYLSHNLADIHFGLGTASVIDKVTIKWPTDGKETVLLNVPANQFLVVPHPDL